jgi:outer membrane biosynthesis protein TonB
MHAAACALASIVAAQSAFSPPRYRSGAAPALPALVVGGGEVLLEATIDREGRVAALRPLRTTPPFADLLADTVRGWRFAPAEEFVPKEAGRVDSGTSWTIVESKVLVAGVFRAPTLNAPVLGELPRDVAPASDDVAAALATAEPPYPPGALNGGLVLLEAHIGPDGALGEIAVLESAPPFDEPARTALRGWKFRPARAHGIPVASFVYVLFGFPPPVSQAPVR